jgi:hypothetical protein
MPSYCVNQILFVLGGFSSGSLQKNPMAEWENFLYVQKMLGHMQTLRQKVCQDFACLALKPIKSHSTKFVMVIFAEINIS